MIFEAVAVVDVFVAFVNVGAVYPIATVSGPAFAHEATRRVRAIGSSVTVVRLFYAFVDIAAISTVAGVAQCAITAEGAKFVVAVGVFVAAGFDWETTFVDIRTESSISRKT